MKIRKPIAMVFVVCLLMQGNDLRAASYTDLNQLTAALASDSALLSHWVTDQLKYAVPFNSTAGNSDPKQLKVFGIEVGAEAVVSGTKNDRDAFHNLNTQLVDTNSIDVMDRTPVPMILGHAKIGLPWGFDAGVRLGGIPSTTRDNGTTHSDVKNKVFGLDLRKALIEEGAVKPFGLTLGLNYTHANGSFDISTSYSSLSTTVGGQTASIQNGQSLDHADWNTNSYGVQLLMDKQILFLTPYIGISENYNTGHVNGFITTTGDAVVGGTSTPISATGTSTSPANKWDTRGLLGIEFSILPFTKLDIGGEYAGSKNVAGVLGLRIQFR